MQTELVTLQDLRLAILRQHTQLAQLLDELEIQARRVVAMGDECAGHLNVALVLVHNRVIRSLAIEEERLSPLLDSLPPEPAAILRASLGGHAEQRERLAGLLHDRVVFADPKTLAHEAIAFVHAMRAEMAEEDQALRSLG